MKKRLFLVLPLVLLLLAVLVVSVFVQATTSDNQPIYWTPLAIEKPTRTPTPTPGWWDDIPTPYPITEDIDT